MIRIEPLAACALIALCACEPQSKEATVLVYNTGLGRYEPQNVKFKYIDEKKLVNMESRVAKIYDNAEFVIDENDPKLSRSKTEEELLAAMRKKEGSPVIVSFLETNGTLVPADFHSLNIATTYYNMERAFSFFSDISALEPDVFASTHGTPTVYYFPDFTMNGEKQEDNAMFFSLAQSFFIFPFKTLQRAPIAINGGAMGHEYAHSIFNRLVSDKQALPEIFVSWTNSIPSPGANLLKALDEGSADIFGAGITCDDSYTSCDPEFIGLSLDPDYLKARRLDVPHCLSDSLASALVQQSFEDFANRSATAYQVGSVFASAMWKATSDQELVDSRNVSNELKQGEARKNVFQALYKAQGGGSGMTNSWRDLVVSAGKLYQSQFSLVSDTASSRDSVLDVVVEAAGQDTPLKKALCRAFMDRFRLTSTEIAKCAGIQPSIGDCNYAE